MLCRASAIPVNSEARVGGWLGAEANRCDARNQQRNKNLHVATFQLCTHCCRSLTSAPEIYMRKCDHLRTFVVIGLVKPRKSLLDLAYRLVCISQPLMESINEIASVDFSSPLGISSKFVQVGLRIPMDKAMIFVNGAQKLCLGTSSSPSGLRLGLVYLGLYPTGN